MYRVVIELQNCNREDSPTGVRLAWEQGRGKSWQHRTIKVIDEYDWLRTHVVLLERKEIAGSGNESYPAAILVAPDNYSKGGWVIGEVWRDAHTEDLTIHCGTVRVPLMK